MIGHSFLFAFLLLAQQPSSSERQWTFSQNVTGSANESGVIVKSDTGLGYGLTRFFSLFGGVPVYFVHGTSTATTTTSGTTTSSGAGLGNIYGGLRLSAGNAYIGYSSNIVVAAPTGDEDRGFSTGRVSVDWTNTIRGTRDRVSPYLSGGVANTVSDTAFFVRPFASHGTVGHVDGGATFRLAPMLDVGGSLYAVKGSGDQEIVSRVKGKSLSSATSQGSGSSKQPFQDNAVTQGTADIADDKGFSTWLAIRPQSAWNLNAGYNRSATYGLDSFFFGLGFQVTH